MTSEEYKKRPYHLSGLLWTARILGTIVAGLLFYLGFSELMEEIRGHSPSPLVTLIGGQYFLFITLTIAFIGLVLAYWIEGLGGGISFVALVVFFIGWADFHMSFILAMFLMALPSILYLVYWWMIFRYHRGQSTSD